jgi:ABC-type uncharacterized transport system substrate-binding protein
MIRGALARAAVAIAFAAWPAAVAAHPHVFIDASAEIVFGDDGRVVAVRQVWAFDVFSSARYAQGYDANGDGAYTTEELAPLAQLNMDSLANYAFFTYMVSGDLPLGFAPPRDYWLTYADDILTLHFTLPTDRPYAVSSLPTSLSVVDPEYFISFAFTPPPPDEAPVALVDAPDGCAVRIVPPIDLDPGLASRFAEIPAGEPLPPDLAFIARDLNNAAEIDCP